MATELSRMAGLWRLGGEPVSGCSAVVAASCCFCSGSSIRCSAAATPAAMASSERGLVLGWPKRSKLAHEFLWEHSWKRLKLAQLRGQLGVFLTSPTAGCCAITASIRRSIRRSATRRGTSAPT
jgi:hypothetical protein